MKKEKALSRATRKLDPEEVQLWKQVQKTILPLKSITPTIEEFLSSDGMSNTDHELEINQLIRKPDFPKPVPFKPFLPAYVPPVSQQRIANVKIPFANKLDEKTRRKLAKGKVQIEARIDLHGMTQFQAHQCLSGFLAQASASDMRIVLIITGKGRNSDGILRRMLPLWLAEPAFSQYVSGYRAASPSHGGEGAFYIRLRRSSGKG